MEYKAIMYFGPKEGAFSCCSLNYAPTPEQIKNIWEMFGWEVEILPEK